MLSEATTLKEKQQEIVLQYRFQRSTNDVNPGYLGFREFLETTTQANLSWTDNRKSYFIASNSLDLYIGFFDPVKVFPNGTTTLDELKSVDDYIPTKLSIDFSEPSAPTGQLLTELVYYTKRDHGKELAATMKALIWQELARRFPINGPTKEPAGADFMRLEMFEYKSETFSYGGKGLLANARNNLGTPSEIRSCRDDVEKWDTVDSALMCINGSVPSGCKNYCEVVARMRETEKEMEHVFDAMFERLDRDGGSLSFLPQCAYYKQGRRSNCWTRIATEEGMCYAAYSGGMLLERNPFWDRIE